MNPCSKEKELHNLEEFANEMRPLIPTLKKIVEQEEAKTWLSIKLANGLKIAGIIIGIIGGIFAICWNVWNEVKK